MNDRDYAACMDHADEMIRMNREDRYERRQRMSERNDTPKYVLVGLRSGVAPEYCVVVPASYEQTHEQALARMIAQWQVGGFTTRVLKVVEPPKTKYRVGVSILPGEPPISAWRAQARIDGDIRCTAFSHDADTARRAVRAAMAVLHPDAEEETT